MPTPCRGRSPSISIRLALLAPWLLATAACRAAGPEPLEPLPSPAQLAWHQLEFYGFLHFNMNTFTGREWGEGDEAPDLFQPTQLDCGQWARVAREAGMKGLILTAKHHDGFCLWPTAYSEHDVASSSWREGRGDVVGELARACREQGLLFGVYLSPWDRNNPHYGDSPRYDADYDGQVQELLTRYGPVFEFWQDGACGEGPNGKRQVYDWERYRATVKHLQPQTLIFSDVGPGVRWIGNERGIAGETCWGMLSPAGFEPGLGAPSTEVLNQGQEDGTHWIPGECDVSIRPGWYYHPEQDTQVKSVGELLEIWHGSVGRGCNLLLNLPVDRRGLVHENDVAALRALRAALDAIYGQDLAHGARATASHVRSARFGPRRVLDGDPGSYWCPGEGRREATLELDLGRERLCDRVRVEECLALGQRVSAFAVEGLVDGSWRELARGTTIGARRILCFPAVTLRALRVRVLAARAEPTLAEVQLFLAPEAYRCTTPPAAAPAGEAGG